MVSACYPILVTLRPPSETNILDPLLVTASLPLCRTYYPVGFPLDLATNSVDVMAAAAECWGDWAPEFDREPITIRAIVQPDGALASQPSFRCQGHLFSVISGADNFAVADLDRLFAFLLVSARTASDHTWLRWFFLESVAYTLLAQKYVVPVHAACVARRGRGILLCGPSGAGKTTLSYACARADFTFVSDDCTWLLPHLLERRAIGRSDTARFCPDATRFFPELDGFVERARPNGELSVEVPMRAFRSVKTAAHCSIRTLAFLDRSPGIQPSIEKIPADEALRLLLRDHATYGSRVDDLHEKTIRRLVAGPVYRLRYDNLEQGRKLVENLLDE
jgi:hypothetical protein